MRPHDHPPERLDPAVHFLAGGLVELLIWWVEARSSLSGGQIESVFQKFAARASESVGAP